MIRLCRKAVIVALLALVRLYQIAVSPVLHLIAGPGYGCRFQPTCSQYAMEAVKVHGIFKGLWLATRRVLRCHPFGGQGYDPVPPPK
jgi:putative membrane protein insertion efficiency factor